MTIRKGLTFSDRIAPLPEIDGYLFVCQRVGHKPLQKQLANVYKSDATDFRNAHDLTYHNATLKHVGYRPERNIGIAELLVEWRTHCQSLEREGKLSWKTVAFYSLLCDHLAGAARDVKCATVLDIDNSVISRIVRWFTKNTESKGATTKKALSMLKSAIAWKGIPAPWQIPSREIDAEKREKRDLDAATIRNLIAAMPAGSIEETCALLKSRTGARDVEIYEAQPEDFALDLKITTLDGRNVRFGVWRPTLHSKRKQKPHVYILTESLADKVRPWIEKTKSGDRMFTLAGRPIDKDSLRRRLRNASAAAKPPITPPIQSLAPIRSEVATIVIDERGAAAESDFVGHSEQVARQWYYKDKLTTAKIVDKLRIAELLEAAIPSEKSA